MGGYNGYICDDGAGDVGFGAYAGGGHDWAGHDIGDGGRGEDEEGGAESTMSVLNTIADAEL